MPRKPRPSAASAPGFDALKWRCIGPPRGGRVVAVAGDPANKMIFYFGACAGGIWKTDRRRRLLALRLGRLHGERRGRRDRGGALGPQRDLCRHRRDRDPARRLLWRRRLQVDRCRPHLEPCRPQGERSTSAASASIRRIPTSSSSRRSATSSAPMRSAASSAPRMAARAGRRCSIAAPTPARSTSRIDPNNPRIVFATLWQTRRNFWNISSGGPGSGLFRSMDGGDSWEEISRAPGLPDGPLGKIGVSVSPARSGRVCALVEAVGEKTGLYRSDDYGARWTQVSSNRDLMHRPWYYTHVFADPAPRRHGLRHQSADVEIDRRRRRASPRSTRRHGDNHDLWIDPVDPQPHDRGQ